MMELLDNLPDLRGVPAADEAGPPPGGLSNVAPPNEAGTLPLIPGMSKQQVKDMISQVKSGKELLEEYRQIQGLQLTSLQIQLLAAIRPEKLNQAPLRDLVGAFKILKDKELVMDGKPTEIIGLAGYLMALEQNPNAAIDITPQQQEEELPEL